MADSLSVDDNVVFFAALSVFNDAVDEILLIAIIPLWKQDILGSVGDPAPQGNVSRTAAHYLDDAAPLMGGGRIPYLINSLHGCVDSCIKTDGIIGTCDVKVNGSWKSDGIDPQGRKFSRSPEGTVTADDNDSVDAVLPADLCTHLLAFLRLELFTTRCIKDRASPVDGIGNADAVHIHDLFLEKSRISSHDALYLEAFIDGRPYDCTDRRVHSGRVAAACQYADGLNLFFCHMFIPPNYLHAH